MPDVTKRQVVVDKLDEDRTPSPSTALSAPLDSPDLAAPARFVAAADRSKARNAKTARDTRCAATLAPRAIAAPSRRSRLLPARPPPPPAGAA